MSNLAAIRERIGTAAAAHGRAPNDVTLVVVTKDRTVAQIMELYEEGQRDFAENRAQELATKAGQLPDDVEWHFVGPLQTNKVRIVRPLVSLLHSLDRIELVNAWVKGPGMPPPALVQVRIGEEESKHGVEPAAAISFCRQAAAMGVPVRGLMTIPPPITDLAVTMSHFRLLAELGAELTIHLPEAVELSMGMSDDYELAVSAGATYVRIGRAIFEPVPN